MLRTKTQKQIPLPLSSTENASIITPRRLLSDSLAVRLKRIPRFFVVWHGEPSVEIILSELIIAFFRLFFNDKKRRQKHAEFISEFCVFLFALSIGRFRRMLKNILMRSCLYLPLFKLNPPAEREKYA